MERMLSEKIQAIRLTSNLLSLIFDIFSLSSVYLCLSGQLSVCLIYIETRKNKVGV